MIDGLGSGRDLFGSSSAASVSVRSNFHRCGNYRRARRTTSAGLRPDDDRLYSHNRHGDDHQELVKEPHATRLQLEIRGAQETNQMRQLVRPSDRPCDGSLDHCTTADAIHCTATVENGSMPLAL